MRTELVDRADFPSFVHIELTNLCNLGCAHCFGPKSRAPRGFMKIELLTKILTELERYRLQGLELHWRGEPLLHPELYAVLDTLDASGLRCTDLFTNGVLVDATKARRLASSSVRRVIFSLDAAGYREYQAVRGGSLANVEAAIQRMLDARGKNGQGPQIGVAYVTRPGTREDGERFWEKWKHCADFVFWQPFNDPETPAPARPGDGDLCAHLFQRLFVSWTGECHPCCMCADGELPLGSVYSQSIHAVWNGSAATEICRQFAELGNVLPVCGRCNLQYGPKYPIR